MNKIKAALHSLNIEGLGKTDIKHFVNSQFDILIFQILIFEILKRRRWGPENVEDPRTNSSKAWI